MSAAGNEPGSGVGPSGVHGGAGVRPPARPRPSGYRSRPLCPLPRHEWQEVPASGSRLGDPCGRWRRTLGAPTQAGAASRGRLLRGHGGRGSVTAVESDAASSQRGCLCTKMKTEQGARTCVQSINAGDVDRRLGDGPEASRPPARAGPQVGSPGWAPRRQRPRPAERPISPDAASSPGSCPAVPFAARSPLPTSGGRNRQSPVQDQGMRRYLREDLVP